MKNRPPENCTERVWGTEIWTLCDLHSGSAELCDPGAVLADKEGEIQDLQLMQA